MGLRLHPRISLGIGGLQDRLLVTGPLTEHAIQAEADEQGNKRKDDNGSQR
jgi:hypothetical protein